MTRHMNDEGFGKDRNFIDYLLYALAGSALAAVSFSFLLWLRF